jgi:predicted regulator of Ras-like GTPase activity (Roadblock/LC7/MglB family)
MAISSEGLKELRTNAAVKGSAVISKDGIVVAADLPAGVYLDTFAIMCATVLGAAITAHSELNLPSPKNVVITSEGDSTIILNAGKKTLIVVLIGKGSDIPKAIDEISPTVAKFAA